MRKFTYVFLPYVVLMVLLIGLAYVPGYNVLQSGPSPAHEGSQDYYYYFTTILTVTQAQPTTAACTDGLRIAASYDGNVRLLRFDGWGFTPSGMIRGYIDMKPAWDTGLTAPDGYVWGLVLISLSPGQHTVYLVDLPTGRQSCTVTIVA